MTFTVKAYSGIILIPATNEAKGLFITNKNGMLILTLLLPL